MKNLLFCLILLGAVAPCQLFGQQEHTLLGYYFDNSTWAPSVEDGDLVAGTVMSQTGVEVTGFANGVNGIPDMAPYSRQWPETFQLMSPTKYYEFTVVGAPDKVIKITKLKLWNRYMNNGPGVFTLRSDANGDAFSTNIYQAVNIEAISWQSHSVTITLPPIVDGENITFRLYAGGASNSMGTWSLDSVKVEGYEILPLSARVFLEGPLAGALMNDGLHTAGLIPLLEPYSAMGYIPTANAGVVITANALSNFGDGNAIVDWVFVELRSAGDAGVVVASKVLLLERDGDIVETDGYRRPHFDVPIVPYFVAVRHRNHLPVMTAGPATPGVIIDFTSPTLPTWGTDAQTVVGAKLAMWAGDVSGDGLVKYTGVANDRDPILVDVGSTTPNSTVSGYHSSDVNMDGMVKYTGATNDRDPILVNVGSTIPNNVRAILLP